jgi:hypothetical protein
MLTDDAAVTEVTAWLRKLEAGHDHAAQRLWDVFFECMVRLTQERMRTNDRRVADAEDVALSAFASFCRGVENQRFPELTDTVFGDCWSASRSASCCTCNVIKAD